MGRTASLRAGVLCCLIASASVPAAAHGSVLPAGDFVETALAVDLQAELFRFVVDEVVDAIPPALVVGSTPPREAMDLWICSQDFWLENLTVYTDWNVATIQTLNGQLNLVLDFDLWVNHPGDPTWVILDGCVDDACALWVGPANVHLELPIALEVATDASGNGWVDVQFGPLQQDISDAIITNLRLGSCALTTLNAWWYDNSGENLFDTLIGDAVAEIDGTIAQTLADTEADLEEALQALWISGDTELLEVPVAYRIEPTAVEHTQAGVRLVLGGSVDAAKAPCISDLDPGGSYWTNSPPPQQHDNAWHVRSLVGDELINQGLYGVWRGGVLCFEAADLGGTPLTTSVLALLLGETFESEMARLVGDQDAALLIRTMPWEPPIARFDGAHDITIAVRDLDIEFYVELLDRPSRLTALTLDIVVGVDIGLTDDGALFLEVELVEDAFQPTITYDELSPEVGIALLENFSAILDVAIGAIAGDALAGGGFTVALPTLGGLGLADWYVEPDGAVLDWLSGSYGIGPSTGGTSTGCDAEGGCGAEGEGCAAEAGGCALDSGCGDEDGGCLSADGGCNVEDVLISQGCSAAPSPEPTDTGCSGDFIEAACGHSGRGVRADSLTVLVVVMVLVSLRRRR